MLDVKIEQFEGPLALLVKMIDEAKLDITQVSLAQVADQYVAKLRTLTNIDPEDMADFLVVASRLLLIKAKALLPYLLPEEEQAIDDFEKQLKMYKEFLEATKKIEQLASGKSFMFEREFNRKAIVANLGIFAPPKNLDALGLKQIFLDIISKLDKVVVEKIEEKTLHMTISLEEKIIYIKESILTRIRSRFSELISQATSKVEVVVSFLAMLELIKQRTINADQDELFSEIEIFQLEKQLNQSFDRS